MTQLNSVQKPDFCLLFEKCPGQYLVLLPDSNFTIVAVTDAYAKVTMTKPSDILYRGIFEVFPDNPNDLHATGVSNLTASLNRVILNKTHDAMAIQKYDIRRPQSEGGGFEERYWCPVNSPVLGANNELLYIIHRVEDVTEYIKLKQKDEEQSEQSKQLQMKSDKLKNEMFQREKAIEKIHEKLRQSEELSHGVLEKSFDCVIGINHWGMITHWNTQAEKTFGWSKDEALGKNMPEMIIPPGYRKLHEKGFKHFLKTGATRSFNRRIELKGIKKNGAEFPIELSVTPLKCNDSYNFYGFIRDITERVESVEQLQQAKDQAENASFAKSSFLANMSHEIRTPLAAILGFTELLADPTIEAERKYSFNEAIKRNGELLLNLINEILDLSKVEAGKLEADVNECHLYELISDVLSSLSIKASQKGIKLMTQYAHGVPKIIYTDTLKLKQILLNIIGNAVKFTEHGCVNVRVAFTSQKDSPTLLSFTVKDTGIGISPEDREKLFQPFSQVDTSLARKFGGTGLGLMLSKRYAQLLGGDLSLGNSTKGQGSTFIITIDPHPHQILKPELQNKQDFRNHEYDKKNETLPTGLPPTSTASTSGLQRLDGIKILLAEDSLDNQFLISQILKKAGAQVELAENGKIALEKTQNHHFDIFLIDIQMPIMDGYTTVTELRKQGYEKPIIALTANALQGDRERSLLEGFNEHISKPINRQALIEIIFRYCKERP